MSTPSAMKAIKCTGPGKATVENNVPVPEVPADYLIVKIEAVALNPTDWKHIHKIATESYNHSVGCDYAGTVVSVGSAVTKPFKVGDRVMGFIHGLKHEDASSGAFAEYAKAKGDIQIHIPPSMSFQEAAGMPTGINTVGQSMYESMGLAWPNNSTTESTPLLIYGGSSATGMYAIKYAKLSGMTVLTTCSTRNFDKLRALGADYVFDYQDPQKCIQAIKDATTKAPLNHCIDCISSDESAEICAAALSPPTSPSTTPKKYNSLLPLKFPRTDVQHEWTIGYSVLGEPYTFFGNKIHPTPENYEFAKKWWGLAETLIAEGKLTPLEPSVRKGGLQGVLEGLEDLRLGRVSGEKLVYRIAERE